MHGSVRINFSDFALSPPSFRSQPFLCAGAFTTFQFDVFLRDFVNGSANVNFFDFSSVAVIAYCGFNKCFSRLSKALIRALAYFKPYPPQATTKKKFTHN